MSRLRMCLPIHRSPSLNANRLIQVLDITNGQAPSQAKPIARYGYDPLDRRLWKEQYRSKTGQALPQPLRTYFLYADEGLIAQATQAITLNADQTVSAAASPQISSQYGPRPNSPFTTGILFVKTKNSNGQDIYAYLHHNHLDTPLQATDKQGNIVWAAQHEPFGKTSITTPSASSDKPTIELNLRLPGQYEDEETGLHYNWHRYYDPQTGRYISSDPIGLEGGINRYQYVGGNPVSLADPRGLDNPGMGPYGPYWTGVQVCSRPVNISWVGGANAYLPQHNWVQTGTYEAGMGAQCPIPGQGCSDTPGAQTQTINHSGQSADPSATCRPIPNVDEQCVSDAIRPGQSTGRWMPWNQCQSFAQSVIERCTTNGTNRPFIGYPKP